MESQDKKETIIMFGNIILIYLVGCVFSFIVVQLCNVIKDNKETLPPNVVSLGVCLSWFVVVFFLFYITVGIIQKRKELRNKEPEKDYIYDAKKIKITIDEYWVPATKYGAEFDPHPELPIKGSPLCEAYYAPNPDDWDEMYCKNCPIRKAGFGCLSVQFFLKYQRSAPGPSRKRSAMILGKIFSDVYKQYED